MQANFRIKQIKNAKDKDLAEALDIYVHTVDENADTPTTQIRDYIEKQYNDKRKMFFYILYSNEKIVGFSEYAYLPDTETLFIDYLCTRPRSHTFFYMFYHLLFEEISEILKKEGLFIKYIATELSLKKDSDKKYIDVDSNYFRQLLSAEHFKVLKVPYYQLYYNTEKKLSVEEYNLAISPQINGLYSGTNITKEFYNSLLNDIYINHYSAWYEKYANSAEVKNSFKKILEKTVSEFTNVEIDDISSVNCVLLQQGLCKQINIENVTLHKKRSSIIIRTLSFFICIILSAVTLFLCYKEYNNSLIPVICSFLTIVVSSISLIQFIIEQFR